MNKCAVACMACALLISSSIMAKSEDNEDSDLVKFLVSNALLTTGKDGQKVPLSYYIGNQSDIDAYFGDYICNQEDSCHVVDSLYSEPYAILGRGMPFKEGMERERKEAQAQIERTDMKYGADIYDAATWQIAIGLASKNGLLDPNVAKELVDNQNRTIAHKDNRATNSIFSYGYSSPITDPKLAFVYRMIATNFHNKDPFFGGKYSSLITWDYDPDALSKNDPEHHSADFFKYSTTWSDLKPITGENAWAQLIGPLQADYLLSKDGKLAANTPSLVNAMNSLYAFSSMQSGIGAFYYAPDGSLGNQGGIARGEISVENNFSALGGLQILKHVLQNTEQTFAVKKALTQIDVMLNGGITANKYKTVGLLSFLYNGAFDVKRGTFYTHGTAINPESTNDWEPDTSDKAGAMAVDINTWGISALSPETIDQWFGEGTALKMWTSVREKGGYYNDEGKLLGVGFTLQNNADFNAEHILSGEWTAGAINAVESLIEYYDQKAADTTALKADLESMQVGIKHLRNDLYLEAKLDEAPLESYFVKLPQSLGKAYLYASKRFAIPFGWNANPLPSTTSTSWVLMNHFHFNPFQYQGKLTGENYTKPQVLDLSGNKPVAGNILPKAVKVQFSGGDLKEYKALALNYQLESSDQWISATTLKQGEADLPPGTKAISLAFQDKLGNWLGACQVIPAGKICKDKDCNSLYSIAAKWYSDGQGQCSLSN